MREEVLSENKGKASKFADQNHIPKCQNVKGNNGSAPKSRSASSWGSSIVKGFSTDKKTRTLTAMATKKATVVSSDMANQKNPLVPSHSRIKRSLMGDLSFSANANQVHPQECLSHRRQSSRDLFIELDHLRSLLRESKQREFELQAELEECRRNPRNDDLETELQETKADLERLRNQVCLLEEEKKGLAEQVAAFAVVSERQDDTQLTPQNVEMEVFELRRLNKELQLQKRNLACRLSSLESQLTSLAKASESEIVAKIEAEASLLRHTNEDLCKQVEGLQMSRLNEVEELAYLRWVNSCLRSELRNSCLTMNPENPSSPKSMEGSGEFTGSLSCQSNEYLEYRSAKRSPFAAQNFTNIERQESFLDQNWVDVVEGGSSKRRHSISGDKRCAEELEASRRRQSDGFICIKEMGDSDHLPSEKGLFQKHQISGNVLEESKISASLDVEKRALRVPNPPPRPASHISSKPIEKCSAEACPPPPPPPPPPPLKLISRSSTAAVQRAPQVVEFYHSLMKRDSRKDSSNGGICETLDVANVHSNMIGEIENRSSYLLAIKADVETQGEFVNYLIKEVNDAAYRNIEDVLAFVKWLDDELCFLVDERAVLKHFDWPEKKADTLREAAFGYRDLKKLEIEVSSFKEDPRLPCDISLKKMVALSEKMERSVYGLLRTRETLVRNCKEYHIPTDWMLDSGIISKIKLGAVKLAKKYMERVAMELQSKATSEKDPAMDYMLLQGVRFAFRIHQFAGGFDAETMHAFEELRDLAHVFNKK